MAGTGGAEDRGGGRGTVPMKSKKDKWQEVEVKEERGK